MKRALMCGLLVVCLTDCAYTPTWSEYHGLNVMRGTGGTTMEVRGMEVWNSGTPPRRYAVLGTMRSVGGSHSDLEFEIGQIVKAARMKGADALVLVKTYERMDGINLYSGKFERAPEVTAMLIRYL